MAEQIGSATGYRIRHERVLDGLRGVASLIVLGHHMRWRRHAVVGNGFFGVDILFVLSGFLITAMLVGELDLRGRIELGRFYTRRALRLLPAAYLWVVVTYVASAEWAAQEGKLSTLKQGAAGVVLYVYNWIATPDFNPAFGPAWSLSIEEQFYFVWPLILLLLHYLLQRRGWTHARIVRVLVAASLFFALTRALHWGLSVRAHDFAGIWRCYLATHCRADSILIGCLAAIWVSRHGLPSDQGLIRVLAPAAAIILLVATVLPNVKEATERPDVIPHPGLHFLMYGGFTLVAICSALVLVGALAQPTSLVARLLSGRALCWIGTITYSLYLWQWFVLLVIQPRLVGWLKAHEVPRSIGEPIVAHVFLGASFLLAYASHRFIERPFLRLKTRWSSEAARPAPADRPGS